MGVAVIIPCHNHAETLQRAIISAYEQCDEVVVCLDICGENTLAALDRLRIANLTVIESANLVRSGVCFTRNLAISMTKEDLIVPLDADDELTPGAVKALTDAYLPGIFVYGGWIQGGTAYRAPPIKMIYRKNIARATWLFARSDWLKVGGYPAEFEAGYEDWAFMCALLEAGIKGREIDFPVLKQYHIDGERTRKVRENGELLLRLMRRNYPGVFRHAIRTDWQP